MDVRLSFALVLILAFVVVGGVVVVFVLVLLLACCHCFTSVAAAVVDLLLRATGCVLSCRCCCLSVQLCFARQATIATRTVTNNNCLRNGSDFGH